MTGYASAAVAYGVCVQSADLVAADQAFALLKPAALAVGMIDRRRRVGTLATAGRAESATARVPTEVWEMVRGQLRSLCVVDARREMHQEECYACHQDFRAPATARSMLAPNWLFHTEAYEDPDHGEIILYLTQDISAALYFATLGGLLASYNLYLPVPQNLAEEPEPWTLTSHVTAIALRPHDESGIAVRPTTSCEAPHRRNGEDTANRVSTIPRSVFDLPPNADRLLARFLRDYHITCRQRAAPALPLATPSGRKRGGERGADPAAAAAPAPGEPGWMLLQTLSVETW